MNHDNVDEKARQLWSCVLLCHCVNKKTILKCFEFLRPTIHLYNNYAPFQPQTKVTETYKGVHWGKYSTKRTDFAGKAGPGPGEYDPQYDITLRAEHLNLRDEEKSKKFDAKIPRYHEWVVKEEEKKVSCFLHVPYLLVLVCIYVQVIYMYSSSLLAGMSWS